MLLSNFSGLLADATSFGLPESLDGKGRYNSLIEAEEHHFLTLKRNKFLAD